MGAGISVLTSLTLLKRQFEPPGVLRAHHSSLLKKGAGSVYHGRSADAGQPGTASAGGLDWAGLPIGSIMDEAGAISFVIARGCREEGVWLSP